MVRRMLNLGILAHVDAGKTTLTERLLYAAGVIGEIGSVDRGTTQTDSMALERRRGITIKSAVVSFAIEDVTVNLIDTPGHPDFIAEVERVLGVLDGAVLVVSAVEGVQAQTRVLSRALDRLGVSTLIFMNKTDRAGADPERVMRMIARRMPEQEGAPVLIGSARSGAGIEPLQTAIVRQLPASAGDAAAPVSGTVFKIDRERGGRRVAYVRIFAGTVRTRDRVQLGRGAEGKVTAISVFADGTAERRRALVAGEIGRVWGLGDVRIGDSLGVARTVAPQFPPPALETVVVPSRPADSGRLRVALAQLADQDPLIDVRQDDARHEMSVSLYGEVQKEVIQSTLASDFGVDVTFRETTPVCIERVVGRGAAVLEMGSGNPYLATMGLRIEPAPTGSGVTFRLDVGVRSLPMYVYKTEAAFADAMDEYVHDALKRGPGGWEVADCLVTMTDCGYSSPGTGASDYRKLTPIVLGRVLREAGTQVCEPQQRVSIELPAGSVSALLQLLSRLGAVVEATSADGDVALLEALLPAARVNHLQQKLPGLSGGEGVLEAQFAGYGG